jgi:hypothetical protein
MKVFQDYKATLRAAALSWGATVGIVALRALDAIPQQLGSIAILTMGVGIATSVSISRFRLTEAITSVFQVGLTSAITMSANVFTDTAIMQLDEDGRVESVDHADCIGWEEEKLVGRKLRDRLVPRSHDGSVRKLEPGTTITSPMLNGESGKFDARIALAALGERDDMGELSNQRLIATISPVVETPNLS